ncbi:hypothetical protein ACJX0J_020389 [Zea mays]
MEQHASCISLHHFVILTCLHCTSHYRREGEGSDLIRYLFITGVFFFLLGLQKKLFGEYQATRLIAAAIIYRDKTLTTYDGHFRDSFTVDRRDVTLINIKQDGTSDITLDGLHRTPHYIDYKYHLTPV